MEPPKVEPPSPAAVRAAGTALRSIRRTGRFSALAREVAVRTGQSTTFAVALGIVAVWGLTGPLFHFSDTWQLVINTGTTIVTFLMVFLIQNTQNRDAQALQLKVDELLRAVRGAHTALMDLEELSDEELAEIKAHYLAMAHVGRERLRRGQRDTGRPRLDLGTRDVDG